MIQLRKAPCAQGGTGLKCDRRILGVLPLLQLPDPSPVDKLGKRSQTHPAQFRRPSSNLLRVRSYQLWDKWIPRPPPIPTVTSKAGQMRFPWQIVGSNLPADLKGARYPLGRGFKISFREVRKRQIV